MSAPHQHRLLALPSTAADCSNGDVAGERGSTVGAFWNFFRQLFGAGILALPHSFALVGGYWAIGLWLLAVPICVRSMLLVIECSELVQARGGENKQQTTLPGLAQAVWSRAGYYPIALIVIVLELAFCTGWLIVATENIVLLGEGHIERHAVIAILFPALFCLASVRWLSQLWWLSVFGFVVYLVGVIGVSIWAMSTGKVHSKTPATRIEESHTLSDLVQFFGSALYAMEAILMALPVKNSMRRPGDAPVVITLGSGLYASIAALFALSCALFGLGSCGTVTDCLPHGVVSNSVRAALSAAMILGYPCILWPVTEIVEELLTACPTSGPSVSNSSASSSNNCLLKYVARFLEVALTCVVAALMSNFHVFAAAVGAILIPLAGFIVPPMLHMRLVGVTSAKTIALTLDMLMIGLGVLMFTVGIHNTFL